jgi:hypothetical protein
MKELIRRDAEMSMDAKSKQDEVSPQPTKTTKEMLLIKKTGQERERWFEDVLEDNDVREASKILHAREKSG